MCSFFINLENHCQGKRVRGLMKHIGFKTIVRKSKNRSLKSDLINEKLVDVSLVVCQTTIDSDWSISRPQITGHLPPLHDPIF
jgi:hypothetical protein